VGVLGYWVTGSPFFREGDGVNEKNESFEDVCDGCIDALRVISVSVGGAGGGRDR
jgi:hypothetical protein